MCCKLFGKLELPGCPAKRLTLIHERKTIARQVGQRLNQIFLI